MTQGRISVNLNIPQNGHADAKNERRRKNGLYTLHCRDGKQTKGVAVARELEDLLECIMLLCVLRVPFTLHWRMRAPGISTKCTTRAR